MKKLTLKRIAGVLAASAMLAGSAIAAPTISNETGSYANWGGFDWASNGTAVVDAYNPFGLTSTFNLTYWASAARLLNTIGLPSGFAGTNNAINNETLEYTIKLVLNETSTCIAFGGPGGSCSSATFKVNFGSFDIFYDDLNGGTVMANQVTGAGITDGIKIIGGVVNASPDGGGFNIISGGNATLTGLIAYTNSAFIAPDLLNTVATSTLQIGSNQTGWAAPTGMPGVAGASDTLVANVQFQADANQTFLATEVPEPSSLALVGLSLAGLAFVRRRKSL